MRTAPVSAPPMAVVAACRGGTARARKDARLAAVLAEFGYTTQIARGDGPLDSDATLVVCDVVSPADDIPVEVALAATRGVDVVVLAPAAVVIDGLAASLLRECRATVVRYDGVEPHRALHARLLELTR